MGRERRNDFDDAWHHVCNRGARRQDVFGVDADRSTFLWLLGRIRRAFALETHAYCLMGNHFHLMVRSRQGQLSHGMQLLGSTYTRLHNRRHGYDGPLFRGRFSSRLVESDEYFSTLIRYIHRNPVADGFCSHPSQYRWSSYRAYLGHRLPPRWLVTGTILGRYGVDGVQALVESSDDRHPELDRVDRAVCRVLGVVGDDLRKPRSLARQLAVLVAGDVADVSAAAIAGHYSVASAGAVRVSRRRTRQLVDRSADLRLRYEQIVEYCVES